MASLEFDYIDDGRERVIDQHERLVLGEEAVAIERVFGENEEEITVGDELVEIEPK